MEFTQQVTFTLAQAIQANLARKEVEVNVAILTSYLLETYKESDVFTSLEKDLVIQKQIDQSGRFGDVTFSLEKCENFDKDSVDDDHEYLMVYQEDGERKCALISAVEDDNVECLDSLGQRNNIKVSRNKSVLYKVRSEWSRRDEPVNIEEDDNSIVVIEKSSDEEENSFEVVDELESLLSEKGEGSESISNSLTPGDLVTYLETKVERFNQDNNKQVKGDVQEGGTEKTLLDVDTDKDTEIQEITLDSIAEKSHSTFDESKTGEISEKIEDKQKAMTSTIEAKLKKRKEMRECEDDTDMTSNPIQNCIRENGRKKLLVIGKTGTGKSSLCNVLTGNLPNAKLFPVSSKASTCTQETTLANANFCGDPDRPLSIIDTIGFDDPTKDHDAKIIAELVLRLQEDCDYINTFVMAVNGQNPRLDGSLLEMIRIFERMFTDKFWDQMVVVFTRLHMDQSSKQRRFEESDNITDDTIAQDYLAEVEKIFGDKGRKLNYLFIDALYRKTDLDEVESFNNETEKLFSHLMSMSDLPTSQVTKVLTENQKLWSKIQKLTLAAGAAAGGAAAAVGVATVKSAVAEAAVKETARALAEKSAAEALAASAQAEVFRMSQELAVSAAVEAPTAVASGFEGLLTAAPMVGMALAVAAWYFGVPVPIPPP